MENENQSVSGINRPRGLRLIEFIEVMCCNQEKKMQELFMFELLDLVIQ